MSLLGSVVITPPTGSPVTIAAGYGLRGTDPATLSIENSIEVLNQIKKPLRAAFTTALSRVTVNLRLIIRVEQVFGSTEAAKYAQLGIPAALVPAGTIVVQLDAGSSPSLVRTYTGCALHSVSPVTQGCTLTTEYVYETSGVS